MWPLLMLGACHTVFAAYPLIPSYATDHSTVLIEFVEGNLNLLWLFWLMYRSVKTVTKYLYNFSVI
jgi:hypothetical protein